MRKYEDRTELVEFESLSAHKPTFTIDIAT